MALKGFQSPKPTRPPKPQIGCKTGRPSSRSARRSGFALTAMGLQESSVRVGSWPLEQVNFEVAMTSQYQAPSNRGVKDEGLGAA